MPRTTTLVNELGATQFNVNNPDYDADPDDPLLARYLLTTRPGPLTQSLGAPLYPPPPEGSFQPPAAGGPAANGLTGQPDAPDGGGPRASDGQLLNRAPAPPPTQTASVALPPQPQPPTGAAPTPAQRDVPPPTPAPTTVVPTNTAADQAAQPAQQAGTAKIPDLKSNWAQRLAMAVLSVTKLAPYANQIVHPKWTEKVQNANAQFGQQQHQLALQQGQAQVGLTQARAAEAQGRAAYAQQQAQEGKGRYLRVGNGVFDQQEGHWTEPPTDKSNLVPIDPELASQRGLAPLSDGKFWVPSAVASQIIKPAPAADSIEITPERGQALGIAPGPDGKYRLPKEGIGPYITATGKPQTPTAESEKIAYQNSLAKLSSEGLLPPSAMTDSAQIARAIDQSSTMSAEEKNQAKAFLAANPTPATAGTTAVIRVEGLQQSRIQSLLDTKTGQLVTMNAEELNQANRSEPGRYVMASQADPALAKGAIFRSLHYTVNNAWQALQALPSLDAGTRAELANMLTSDSAPSAIRTWLQGTIGTTMSPEQKNAVQALALLSEDALTLRTVAGMGQGSDKLREAIKNTIPSGKSPDKGYALHQLDQLDQLVGRLESGVPGLGGPAQGFNPSGNQNQPTGNRPIVQHSPSTNQYRYSLDGGRTWQAGQPPSQ